MPMLCNIRQERFCQFIVQGKDELASYEEAGYAPDRANACKLRHLPHIDRRIRELMQRGAQRAEISEQRVLEELGKIAFANLADYISVNDDGTANIDLSSLDRDQAAAIVEATSSTAVDGKVTTRIKMGDKKGALELIGKRFCMWAERHVVATDDPIANAQTTAEIEAIMIRRLGPQRAQLWLAKAQELTDLEREAAN